MSRLPLTSPKLIFPILIELLSLRAILIFPFEFKPSIPLFKVTAPFKEILFSVPSATLISKSFVEISLNVKSLLPFVVSSVPIRTFPLTSDSKVPLSEFKTSSFESP